MDATTQAILDSIQFDPTKPGVWTKFDRYINQDDLIYECAWNVTDDMITFGDGYYLKVRGAVPPTDENPEGCIRGELAQNNVHHRKLKV